MKILKTKTMIQCTLIPNMIIEFHFLCFGWLCVSILWCSWSILVSSCVELFLHRFVVSSVYEQKHLKDFDDSNDSE